MSSTRTNTLRHKVFYGEKSGHAQPTPVIRARCLGLCGGVRRALRLVEQIPHPSDVTIIGPLVHNPQVNHYLQARGFVIHESTPPHITTPTILIPAHGASPSRRLQWQSAGLRIIDATCPRVARLQRIAHDLATSGWYVLLVGRRGHAEVEAITADLAGQAQVIESPRYVACYAQPRLALLCQTTCSAAQLRAVHQAVVCQNPASEVRLLNTACPATRRRQAALRALLGRVDAVVVVGGRSSNNTHQLVELCSQRNMPVHHVEHARELRPEWFAACRTVGLTAGASTLDQTIDGVDAALHHVMDLARTAPIPPARAISQNDHQVQWKEAI